MHLPYKGNINHNSNHTPKLHDNILVCRDTNGTRLLEGNTLKEIVKSTYKAAAKRRLTYKREAVGINGSTKFHVILKIWQLTVCCANLDNSRYMSAF